MSTTSPTSPLTTSSGSKTNLTSHPTPKITVHWLDRSRSQRILWLLEELSLPYTLSIHKRGADFRAPAALKSIHPLGKSPVIEIEEPDGERIVLVESGAIAEYLVDRFGGTEKGLVPGRFEEGGSGRETEAWRRYRLYMHFVEGSLMPPLVIGLVVDGIRNAPAPFFIRPILRSIASRMDTTFLQGEYRSNFSFGESQLPSPSSSTTTTPSFPSICGPTTPTPTTADILLEFPLSAALAKGVIDAKTYPRIGAFVEACRARGAYKRAVERVVKETGGYEVI